MSAEISDERLERLLTGVKIDLGILNSTAYDNRLITYINAAVEEIEREGASLAEETVDGNLIIQAYAAWKWRTRSEPGAMPRALRYSINNLVFHQKAKPEE